MNIWDRIRHRADRDLDEEIGVHLRMAEQDRISGGESPDQARMAAAREFGNQALVKETTRAMWGWTRVEGFLSDLRYARRTLRKTPLWTGAVILSLALGVGANTAIFSLTYAVLLKSLPVQDPAALIRYTFRNGGLEIGLSGPLYDVLQRYQSSSEDLLAWSNRELAVEDGAHVEHVKGGLMSGNGFRVLGLAPALGAAFTDHDDVEGGGASGYPAVLRYEYWKAHYNGSTSVLGRALVVNGAPVRIIGVLPAGFEGLIVNAPADIVVPLAFERVLSPSRPARHQPGSFWLTVMGRLKPGNSLTTAGQELAAIEQGVRREADPQHKYLDGFFAPFRLGIESGRGGRSYLRKTYQRPLLVLEMLVCALLVLCCANTALLVLAQVISRVREFALRAALGAARGRLLRQVLLELTLLSIPGILGAAWIGWILARTLAGMLASIGEPPAITVTPNAALLGFTAALGILSMLAAGLWPAIRASQVAPALQLKNSPQAGWRKTGSWIVQAQVAASVTLVVAALLLGTTFLHLQTERSGFRVDGGTLADLNLTPLKLKPEQLSTAVNQVLDELNHMPGIEAAAAMSMAPLRDGFSTGDYHSIGKDGAVHADSHAWPEFVTPGYFSAMGTRIVQGRSFERADVGGGCVTVLSQSAARYFFAGQDPLGGSLYGGAPAAAPNELRKDSGCRVIGVAEDARFRSLREPPPRMIYKLFEPASAGPVFTLAVRGEASASADGLRSSIKRAVPSAPQPIIFTFETLVNAHLKKERMLISLSGSFAAVALVLTAVGLFGLLMRTVSQQTREIGVRMALGAERRSVVSMILRRSCEQVARGLLIGIALAIAASRAMRALLYQSSPGDLWIFACAIVIILLTGAIAAFLPARRAVRIDPMTALRVE